jgi:hypothetical protein
MAKETNESVAGICFRVGDAYIWSEIAYLDSSTDYREYLPDRLTKAMAGRGELLMLDSSPSDPKLFAVITVAAAAILLLLGYLFCVFVESL